MIVHRIARSVPAQKVIAGCCLLLALMLMHCRLASAEAPMVMSRETQLKAAFVYKFLGFIDWNDRVSDNRNHKLICVWDQDPIAQTITQIADIEPVSAGAPKIEVKSIENLEEVAQCNLLYIGQSGQAQSPAILRAIDDSDVVTVSDAPGFLDHGGTIQLRQSENHIRFTINPERVRPHGVQFSSQLLALQEKKEGNE